MSERAACSVIYVNRNDCDLRSSDCGRCEEHWHKITRIFDRYTKIGEFDVYLCEKHRLGFTNPYPSEDTAHYLYDGKDSADFDLMRGNIFDSIKDYLAIKRIMNMINGKRTGVSAILDYSTGSGRYAVMASRLFPDARVDAVDYQNESPPFIKKNQKRVNYLTVDEFNADDIKYDFIILRHVLEHTHYPVRLLKNLGQRLTSNGMLYVEVPNLDSGCARVFGKYWKSYYVPYHIFHFTRESLADIIDLAGFAGEIRNNEVPLMGDQLAFFTETDVSSSINRFAAIVLHPIQLFIEWMYHGSTCLNARLYHKEYQQQDINQHNIIT
jgi:SAM-dependent methyltransferase